MLAKRYILKEKKVFSALKYKGERKKIGPFLVSYFYLPRSYNRFGIVISQRRVAKATKRNRIKRKIRALLFPYRKKTTSRGAVDMVIVVLYEPEAKGYTQLKEFLEKFFV